MKMPVVFVLSAALFLLNGCSTVEESAAPQTATKIQAGAKVPDGELEKIGEAFFHQIVKALKEKNYEDFSSLYVEEHRRKITKPLFEQMSASFCAVNGNLKQLRFLGTVNKYSSHVLLWSAVFERTKQVNDQLKKAGYDPEAIPDTESLVQMVLGKTDKGWKIIQMGIM